MEKRKNLKYFLISSILHALILALGLLMGGGGEGGGEGDSKGNNADGKQEELVAKKIDIEIQDSVVVQDDSILTLLKKLKLPKPMDLSPPKEEKHGNAGYYGIGIYASNIKVKETGNYLMVVEGIVFGNPAHLAGLRDGDVIFSINGNPMTRPDETRAHNGERDLILGVSRNGRIFFVNITTKWIETISK